MEFFQTKPAEAALDLSDGFFFADEDPQSLAIERITCLQLPKPEPAAGIVVSHAFNAWDGLKCPSGGAIVETPVWGHHNEQQHPDQRQLASGCLHWMALASGEHALWIHGSTSRAPHRGVITPNGD